MTAYSQMLDTHSAIGWVPDADISQLNVAINKANQADLLWATDPSAAMALDSEAQQMADQVYQDLLSVKSTGLKQKYIGYALIATSAIIALTLALGVYKFGPTLMWRFWLRLRGRYFAKRNQIPVFAKEKGNEEEDDQPITMENISVVIALALVVIAAFIVVQPILAGIKGEQFSELGVLGPNMTIGDYPTSVVVGSNISLYTYVGNHMGQPLWYEVLVKMGDNSSDVDPLLVEPVSSLERILNDNETWINPINITLSTVGNNQRIIFELWSMNSSSEVFEFTGRWNQLWINITAIS